MKILIEFLALPNDRRRILTDLIQKFYNAHPTDRNVMILAILTAALFAFFTLAIVISGQLSLVNVAMLVATAMSACECVKLFWDIYTHRISCH